MVPRSSSERMTKLGGGALTFKPYRHGDHSEMTQSYEGALSIHEIFAGATLARRSRGG